MAVLALCVSELSCASIPGHLNCEANSSRHKAQYKVYNDTSFSVHWCPCVQHGSQSCLLSAAPSHICQVSCYPSESQGCGRGKTDWTTLEEAGDTRMGVQNLANCWHFFPTVISQIRRQTLTHWGPRASMCHCFRNF